MMQRLLPLSYAAAGILIAVALAMRAPVFGASEAQTSLLPWYLVVHAALLVGYAAVRGSALRTAELSLTRILTAAALGLALIGSAAMDVVVGCEGFMHWAQGGALAMVLLLAALASIAALATFFGGEDGATEKEGDETAAEAPAVADEGRPMPLRTVASQMRGALFSSVIIVAGLALLAVGFFLYDALRGSLFDGDVVDVAVLPGALRDLFSRTWPLLLVPGVVIVGYSIVTKLGRGVPQAIDRWRYPRSARDLGPAELAFIDRALAELDRYVEVNGFKRFKPWLFVASFGGGVGLMIGVLVATLRYREALSSFYAPPAVGAGWHLVSYGFPPSALPAAFLCLLLYWPLRSLFAHSSRYLSELLTWYSYVSSEKMFSLRGRLVRDVRVGKIRTDHPFKPGDFLHQINLDWAPYAYVTTGALALFTAVLLDRDAQYYTLYTEDRIEVTDYWSGRVHIYPYTAVTRVELECAPRSKGGYDVGYGIFLPDRSTRLVDEKTLLDHLADYEHVDAKLVAAGTHFGFQRRTPINREPFLAFSSACVEDTIKDFDTETGARVARLLHLGDWQALGAGQ